MCQQRVANKISQLNRKELLFFFTALGSFLGGGCGSILTLLFKLGHVYFLREILAKKHDCDYPLLPSQPTHNERILSCPSGENFLNFTCDTNNSLFFNPSERNQFCQAENNMINTVNWAGFLILAAVVIGGLVGFIMVYCMSGNDSHRPSVEEISDADVLSVYQTH